MTYSLRVNNDLDVATLVDLAQRAERHGFDQLWVSNDLFLRSAPVLLGVLAAKTDRIKLGVGIMNPYSVHVAEIAMMAATMQEATGGRFLLGVAAGSAEFLAWAGIERSRPLAKTAETIRVARALLGAGDVGGKLPPWFGPLSELRFPPAQRVPVYVGGMSPKMLEMAGRLADGVLPLLYPPEHFADARAQVLRGVEDARRSPSEVDIPACFWVSIADDDGKARLALAAKIAYYGPSFAPYLLARAGLAVKDFGPITAVLESEGLDAAARLIDERMLALGMTGTVSQVVERCLSLRAAGATHLSFGPPLGPDIREAVDMLGTDVLPALTASPANAGRPTRTPPI
jgi:5,10-methylenetetrahydromethanopterin reductase